MVGELPVNASVLALANTRIVPLAAYAYDTGAGASDPKTNKTNTPFLVPKAH